MQTWAMLYPQSQLVSIEIGQEFQNISWSPTEWDLLQQPNYELKAVTDKIRKEAFQKHGLINPLGSHTTSLQQRRQPRQGRQQQQREPRQFSQAASSPRASRRPPRFTGGLRFERHWCLNSKTWRRQQSTGNSWLAAFFKAQIRKSLNLTAFSQITGSRLWINDLDTFIRPLHHKTEQRSKNFA